MESYFDGGLCGAPQSVLLHVRQLSRPDSSGALSGLPPVSGRAARHVPHGESLANSGARGSPLILHDLNNSRLHVIAKITKADETNIDANTAAPINLTLHSMFREIRLEFNGQNVGDTSQLYPYRSVLRYFSSYILFRFGF